jgi:uncharacterized membrane protein YhaH (DUF805 family)
MGLLPPLNFAPRWAAVRTAVASVDVTRFARTAQMARKGLHAAAVAARAQLNWQRLKQSASRAISAATVATSNIDRARIEASVRQAAITGWPVLRELADPRGRCNRKAFLTIALAFLAIQLSVAGVFWLCGIETSTNMNLLLNAPILWIGSTVCFKRLHDVGRSGWWLPGSFAIWFTTVIISLALISIMLDETALDPGQPAFYVAFAAITLPVFGALLWLHTAPSVEGTNKYGPVAGPTGLSMPERAPTAAAAPTAIVPTAPVANAA